jgi:hypothetical protein
LSCWDALRLPQPTITAGIGSALSSGVEGVKTIGKAITPKPKEQAPAQIVNESEYDDEIENDPFSVDSPAAKTDTETKAATQKITEGGTVTGENALAAKRIVEKQKAKTEGGFSNFDFSNVEFDLDPKLTAQMEEMNILVSDMQRQLNTDQMFGGGAGSQQGYQKVLASLSDARASDNAFYTNNIDNAQSGVGAAFSAIGRSLNNAFYDVTQGAVGLYGLATDSNLRSQVASGIGYTFTHVDLADAAYKGTVNYFSNTSIGDMGEDALRFVSGGFATAGVGKAFGAAGTASLGIISQP